MDKVLVDRGLLAECVSVCIRAFGVGDPIEAKLRAILAQPAEAEGVACPVAACISGETGELYHEDYGLKDPVYLVLQSDHLAALSAVTAERDRLESMLIRTTTRHFAQQWKDRADDKKLDECLSEGIAMLEAERDRLQAALDDPCYPPKHARRLIAQLRAELKQSRDAYQHMIDQTTPLEPVPGDPRWSKRIELDEVIAERDRLLEAVELLSRLRGLINCTPENDVDKVPVWISTKHPTVERIDALLAAMAAKEA